MEVDDDASLFEYFLIGQTSAIEQPARHLFPVVQDGQIVCDGSPMIIRHFNADGVDDPSYNAEDPNGIITSAYQIAFYGLSEYAAMRRNQELQTQAKPHKRSTYLTALFTLATGHRLP